MFILPEGLFDVSQHVVEVEVVACCLFEADFLLIGLVLIVSYEYEG